MKTFLTIEITNQQFATELQKLLCWPVDLLHAEIEFCILYNVFGQNLPATKEHPAEFAEINITETIPIKINGIELHEMQIKEEIAFLAEEFDLDFPSECEIACWEDLE